MAYIKIVKSSELGNSWSPFDHIPEARLAELLEERDRKIAHVDQHLRKLCKLDEEIEKLREI